MDGAAAVKMLEPTIRAFCATARTCCAKQGEMATLDACETMFAANNETVASLASGAVTLNPTALSACRAAYEQAAASCEENPVLSACRGVVVGTVPAGGKCRNGAECAKNPGPNTCLVVEGQEGVCEPAAHGKAREACSFTCRKGEDCTTTTYGTPTSPTAICFEDEGYFCDRSESAQCEPLVALGAPCTQDDECGSLAFCSTTCKQRGTEGEACAPCVSSLTCVADKCVSPPFASLNTCEGRSLGPY
jgi:hypothetical protein